jgi:hypothetical protein
MQGDVPSRQTEATGLQADAINCFWNWWRCPFKAAEAGLSGRKDDRVADGITRRAAGVHDLPAPCRSASRVGQDTRVPARLSPAHPAGDEPTGCFKRKETPMTIADLNDRFRQKIFGVLPSPVPGRCYITRVIDALPLTDRLAIFAAVAAFDAFTPDNDPHGEHDFGAFDHPRAGKIFWKIDYYDPTLTCGSEDPADPTKTHRVLTIMLAEEY